MKIKKLTVVLFVVPFFLFIFGFNVSAVDETDSFYENIINDLTDNLDDETIDILNSLGLKNYTSDELSELSLKNVLSVIFGVFKDNIRKPFEFVSLNVAMMIFCVLSKGFISEGLKTGSYFESVVVIFISLYSFSGIIDLIADTVSIIRFIGILMKILLPVLAVLVSFSGKPSLAVSSSAVSIYISEAVIAVCNDFLTSLLCIFSAVSVCASINGTIHITPVIELCKKIFNGVLGFLGTVYSGVLTIRDVIAAGLDRISVKGLKFVLGSAVPIVGGTLSEGLSAVVSALSLFKNTFGIIGIIVALIVVLPVLSQILLWILALYITEYVSSAFGQEKISNVFASLRYVITMLLSLVFFMIFVFLISVSTVLIMSKS